MSKLDNLTDWRLGGAINALVYARDCLKRCDDCEVWGGHRARLAVETALEYLGHHRTEDPAGLAPLLRRSIEDVKGKGEGK